ncbi:hypothetical protein K491DRAFT_410273 [Lophiostoma macrostomum CBS 122681]|uniref:Zn(2)-C6 fungal-type domain-containing protein n=1 Tax=Lophiostoma macrostomum CBS 122681 TaxID=1314788 RepID=A0A6A6T747_9PLEO|nr:hypothetical protein K491DRAFT_410273 [Lophiostoma macrostomum CBS 122681]
MPRRRAVRVCESCHSHKIRCDADATYPCSKCVEKGDMCSIRTRKIYPPRKRAQHSSDSDKSRLHSNNATDEVPSTSRTCPDRSGIVAAAVIEPSTTRIAPVFVGKSGYGTILDAVGGATDCHFFIPATAEAALAADDLEYLKTKGCFTLPRESRELVDAYFHFVHPVFPVIDASAFMHDYEENGIAGINLLLLWSMFSVSASYLPILPQKMFKEKYVQRAKLLFDISQEKDKTVLVQSALLLSFWFADTEDVKQSWYWTGIAFSVAQTLGLQQKCMSTDTSMKISERLQALWCNIWQCCMIRDVWLAFSMGRPLRINMAGSYSLPTSQQNLCKHAEFSFQASYPQVEASKMTSMWQQLITISAVLRDVMTATTLSSSQLQTLESQITSREITDATFVLASADRHLKLHQYATTTALARAEGSSEALRRAADNTTSLIEGILRDELSMYCAPVTVPLVVPAMVTYLNMLKHKGVADLNTSRAKLGVYIELLSSLEDNYPAALIVKRIICTAKNTLVEGHTGAVFGNLYQDSLFLATGWDALDE